MRIKYSAEVFNETHFPEHLTMRVSSISGEGSYYAETRIRFEDLQVESIVDRVFDELVDRLKREIKKQAGLV